MFPRVLAQHALCLRKTQLIHRVWIDSRPDPSGHSPRIFPTQLRFGRRAFFKQAASLNRRFFERDASLDEALLRTTLARSDDAQPLFTARRIRALPPIPLPKPFPPRALVSSGGFRQFSNLAQKDTTTQRTRKPARKREWSRVILNTTEQERRVIRPSVPSAKPPRGPLLRGGVEHPNRPDDHRRPDDQTGIRRTRC